MARVTVCLMTLMHLGAGDLLGLASYSGPGDSLAFSPSVTGAARE